VIDMKAVSRHSLLYQAALAHRKEWKYEDRPIAVEVLLTSRFNLSQ